MRGDKGAVKSKHCHALCIHTLHRLGEYCLLACKTPFHTVQRQSEKWQCCLEETSLSSTHGGQRFSGSKQGLLITYQSLINFILFIRVPDEAKSSIVQAKDDKEA